MLILTGISTALSTYRAIKTTILLQTRYECVSEYVCLCVCVCENMLAWKYVLFVSSSTFKTTLMQKIPLCILTIWTTRNYWFYFQRTRFFNNTNSLSKRILLMLTSIEEILYGKKLCVCSLQNVQRERKRKKMPYVIGGNINSSFISLMCEIFSF